MNWYEIKPQQNADGETDIFIFDEIGIWGIGADQLINQVQATKPTKINLHLNSPGGSVYDGWAIFNYLRAYPAPVTAYVDGMAASIVGVIAMSADEIVMAEASLFHMHLPGIFGLVGMKVDELEDLTKELRKMDGIIRRIYQKRTNASDEQLEEWMTGETYFTPEEALEVGLIDRIEEKVRMVACAAQWKPERYNLARHLDVQNKRQNKGETTMSKELETKVASLTTEKATLQSENDQIKATLNQEKESRQEALKAAQKATETIEANQKRVDAIVALSDKYDKDGDLKSSALKAIQSGKNADEFKDEVLELVAKRPTSQRLEDGEDGDDNKPSMTLKEYNAMSHAERKKIGGIRAVKIID